MTTITLTLDQAAALVAQDIADTCSVSVPEAVAAMRAAAYSTERTSSRTIDDYFSTIYTEAVRIILAADTIEAAESLLDLTDPEQTA
jgi:hypothetical protein